MWKLWAQVGMAVLSLGLITACTVDATTETAEETLTSIVSAKAVTNLEASTTEEGQVTVTFDGQENVEDLNIRYLLHYQYFDGPNAISASKTHTIVPQNGQEKFSYTLEVPSGIHVLFSVETAITYGGKSVSTAQTSDVVEGAALPSVELSAPIVDGNTVYLAWDDRALMSAKDQSGRTPLYKDYEFKLSRVNVEDEYDPTGKTDEEIEKVWEKGVTAYSGTGTSYQEYLAGQEVHAMYRLSLVINDANGNPVVTTKPNVSASKLIKTDTSMTPMAADSIAASQGTLKDGVDLVVELPDYIVTDGSVQHRMKVERTVHDADSWTVVVPFTRDINNDSGFTVTKKDDNGAASYAFCDTDVDTNTSYDYRVTTGYLLSSGSLQSQSSGSWSTETAEPGYAIWLPTDLEVSDGRSDEHDSSMVNTVTWNYEPPKAVEAKFVMTRSDEFKSESFDVTGTSYTDSFTVDDVKIDHNWRYSLKLAYDDGSYSDALVTKNSVGFKTSYATIDFIKDLTASQASSGKVTLSWTEDHSGSEYASDDISYTLQRSETYEGLSSATEEAFSGVKPTADNNYQGSWTIDNLEAGSSFWFLLKATYSGSAEINSTMVQTASGGTLANPEGLSVDDGRSATKLTGSFQPVENAGGYRVFYRRSGSEDEWASLDVSEPSFELDDEVGSGTKQAGTIYTFKVSALDQDGVATSGGGEDTGCLLGPALLNAKAADNDQTNNSFTITWDSVIGAKGYNVNVYLDTDAKTVDDSTYIGTQLVETEDTKTSYQHVFKSSDDMFKRKESNPYPLASRYLVQVVPYGEGDESVSESLIDPLSAHWFVSPVLEASKATSGTSISLSWNAVEGASEYAVYSSSDNASWVLLSKTSDTNLDVPTTSDTYFTITASNGTVTSQKQEYATGDLTNFGYVFKAPEAVSVVGNTFGSYYYLSWKRREGATAYVLRENGITSTTIDVSDLQAGASKGNPEEPGYLYLDTAGYYHYNCQGAVYTDATAWRRTVSLTSQKTIEGATVESLPSSEVENAYRTLIPLELVNILHKYMHQELSNANEVFGGDWWPPNSGWGGSITAAEANPYTNSEGTVTIKPAKGGGKYVSQDQDPAYMIFQNAVIADGFLASVTGNDGSSTVRLWVDSDSDGSSSSGYRGKDPLERCDVALIKMQLPYGEVTFNLTEGLNFKTKAAGVYTFADGSTVYYSDSAVEKAYN